jgi:uncharacterized protein (DUF39 family)
VPESNAATLMMTADVKEMSPDFLRAAYFEKYGVTIYLGVGIPLPILDEEMAAFTAVSDEEIFTQVIDYGSDYPAGQSKRLAKVSYAQLKSGSIRFQGRQIHTVPLSSLVKAREIAEALKERIAKGRFLLGEPQALLPT